MLLPVLKVKICGITLEEVAGKVCELGPDALGILVGFDKKQAPNYVSEETAKEIVKVARRFSKYSFLLTKSLDTETIIQLCSFIGNTHVQLLNDIEVDHDRFTEN